MLKALLCTFLFCSTCLADPPKNNNNRNRRPVNQNYNPPSIFEPMRYDYSRLDYNWNQNYYSGPSVYIPPNIYGPGNSIYHNGGRYDSRNGNR